MKKTIYISVILGLVLLSSVLALSDEQVITRQQLLNANIQRSDLIVQGFTTKVEMRNDIKQVISTGKYYELVKQYSECDSMLETECESVWTGNYLIKEKTLEIPSRLKNWIRYRDGLKNMGINHDSATQQTLKKYDRFIKDRGKSKLNEVMTQITEFKEEINDDLGFTDRVIDFE